MTITFIGHGYVGLVTACVFADLGNTVYVIGRSIDKLQKLKKGDPLIYEPGLSELLKKNINAGRLKFTDKYDQAIPASTIIFIAVGTPPKENGEADLSSVLSVADKIAPQLGRHYTVISCKSTVPVGTNRKILKILQKKARMGAKFDVASCPEFLREGSAISDTFHPDRIVIGSDSIKAINTLFKLHKPLEGDRILVGLESAEIIKYASNSILATKISFANMIALLSEACGADVEEVLMGVGVDKRIGNIFLSPGVGYGGSCFPKDVKALIQTSKNLGVDPSLLQAVEDLNLAARNHFVEKVIKNVKGKKIAVWGLSFKPNTDDIRDAPSIYIINKLLKQKFIINVYDPEAMENARAILKNKVNFCSNPYDCVKDTDALLIVTEWNEFKQINLEKVMAAMKKPVIIDGRNIYDPQNMAGLGFDYISTGRKQTS